MLFTVRTIPKGNSALIIALATKRLNTITVQSLSTRITIIQLIIVNGRVVLSIKVEQ